MIKEPLQQAYPEPTSEMLDSNPLFDAIWNAIKGWDISRFNNGLYSGPTGNDARHLYDAVKAIAQPEQTAEPVAWMRPSGAGYDSAYRDASTVKMSKATGATHWDNGDWIPLYSSPQVAQPEQTVSAWHKEFLIPKDSI